MRFGGEPWGGNGQEDYVRNAHASKLMEACWSRKESLGPGNPGHTNRVELLAKHATVRPAESTDGV